MSHNNIITTNTAYALLCFSLSHSLSLSLLFIFSPCACGQGNRLLCCSMNTHINRTSPNPAFHLLEYLSAWHVLLVLEFTKMPRGGDVRPGGGTFCVTSIALAALPLRLLGCNNYPCYVFAASFQDCSDSVRAQPRSTNFMLH